MRSGSTLLKALLAVADDVSDLPEVNFQKYRSGDDRGLCRMAPEPILVLKRPCWLQEVNRYPRIPAGANVKPIILARDCYEVVSSVKRMMLSNFQGVFRGALDPFLVSHYWCGVYDSLLNLRDQSKDVCLVRYEDLVENPIHETKRLFKYIGSARTEGVDSYNPPKGRKWRWGQDDGSDKIKSLKVCASSRPRNDVRLARYIENSESVLRIQERLDYEATIADSDSE